MISGGIAVLDSRLCASRLCEEADLGSSEAATLREASLCNAMGGFCSKVGGKAKEKVKSGKGKDKSIETPPGQL